MRKDSERSSQRRSISADEYRHFLKTGKLPDRMLDSKKVLAENRKIKNATKRNVDGIEFDSDLEVTAYRILKMSGLEFEYGKTVYTIRESDVPPIPFYDRFYDRKLKKRVWGRYVYKLQAVTYRPDFIVRYGGRTHIIEMKGFENDVFRVKKKLIVDWIGAHIPDASYYEVYTAAQLREVINIIRNEGDNRT